MNITDNAPNSTKSTWVSLRARVQNHPVVVCLCAAFALVGITYNATINVLERYWIPNELYETKEENKNLSNKIRDIELQQSQAEIKHRTHIEQLNQNLEKEKLRASYSLSKLKETGEQLRIAQIKHSQELKDAATEIARREKQVNDLRHDLEQKIVANTELQKTIDHYQSALENDYPYENMEQEVSITESLLASIDTKTTSSVRLSQGLIAQYFALKSGPLKTDSLPQPNDFPIGRTVDAISFGRFSGGKIDEIGALYEYHKLPTGTLWKGLIEIPISGKYVFSLSAKHLNVESWNAGFYAELKIDNKPVSNILHTWNSSSSFGPREYVADPNGVPLEKGLHRIEFWLANYNMRVNDNASSLVANVKVKGPRDALLGPLSQLKLMHVE
ncbi:MAG: hypothetical protein HWE08_01780 [Alphaproteobacteria bacterium]|nr:hypothetical protein [Alphaproteobacteria bacterium]